MLGIQASAPHPTSPTSGQQNPTWRPAGALGPPSWQLYCGFSGHGSHMGRRVGLTGHPGVLWSQTLRPLHQQTREGQPSGQGLVLGVTRPFPAIRLSASCAGWLLLVATGPRAPCRGRGLSGAHSAAGSIKSKRDRNRVSRGASASPSALPRPHEPLWHLVAEVLDPQVQAWVPTLQTRGRGGCSKAAAQGPGPPLQIGPRRWGVGRGPSLLPRGCSPVPMAPRGPRSPFCPRQSPLAGEAGRPHSAPPASLWARRPGVPFPTAVRPGP